MKKLFSKHKWMQILLGFLFLAAGVTVIIVSFIAPANISNWLSIILAVACFLFAASLIFSGLFSLEKKQFDVTLIYGALFISLGVILCVKTTLISEYIILFLGTILICLGGIGVGVAISYLYFKKKMFPIVVAFVSAALLLTFGILTLNSQPEVEKIIYIIVGSLLCVVGLVEMIFGFKAVSNAKKQSKKRRKPKVVDAEIVEKIEEKKDVAQIEEKSNDLEVIDNK